MPSTYEPIATTTLSSSAADITFSSIASSWTDLRLIIVAQSTSADSLISMTYNNDATGNYSQRRISGNGSSVLTGGNNNNGQINLSAFASVAASPNFSMYTVDIFSYAGSTFKTCLITSSADKNGSGAVDYMVGLYRSTSAISTVKIFNSFAAGTTATLYGIKNA